MKRFWVYANGDLIHGDWHDDFVAAFETAHDALAYAARAVKIERAFDKLSEDTMARLRDGNSGLIAAWENADTFAQVSVWDMAERLFSRDPPPDLTEGDDA